MKDPHLSEYLHQKQAAEKERQSLNLRYKKQPTILRRLGPPGNLPKLAPVFKVNPKTLITTDLFC